MNLEKRQQVIREMYRAAANYPKEDAAVAGVYILITGAGRVRTLAINVEPEHVPVILEEQKKVAAKLRGFAKKKRAKKARVIPMLRNVVYWAGMVCAWAALDSILFPATALPFFP